MISAIRDAQARAPGASSQERDANRRLFLVPNAHVARLQVADIDRDGASRPGDRVTGIELVADGVRRTFPIKPTATVVLALGCIESTRLALESFPRRRTGAATRSWAATSWRICASTSRSRSIAPSSRRGCRPTPARPCATSCRPRASISRPTRPTVGFICRSTARASTPPLAAPTARRACCTA